MIPPRSFQPQPLHPRPTANISSTPRELYKRDGLNHASARHTNPGPSGDKIINSSIKLGAIHGLLNTAAFGYSSYALWSRWGSKFKGLAVPRAQVWISALMIPAVGLSAALGGDLVYAKGVGVQRMGEAKEVREEGLREVVGARK